MFFLQGTVGCVAAERTNGQGARGGGGRPDFLEPTSVTDLALDLHYYLQNIKLIK